MNRLQLHWTRRTLTSTLLLPLAWLFSFLVFLRRLAYRRGWLYAIHVGVPVIVVGNITAGGSGKTPLVIWLANALRARGLRPGVVSRGYGGSASGCVDVDRRSDPREVGDEPLLIHYKTGVPVVVGRDRVAAARTLLALHPGIDVILSDDGLQHYRLQRDVELAVLDAATGLGNARALPAGPLREPPGRLATVDAVIEVVRGSVSPSNPASDKTWQASYLAGQAYPLLDPQRKTALQDLPQQQWLAVSGIGQPQGFFDMLSAHGLRFTPRSFADHHAYRADDLPRDKAVLMTEKDAVKCLDFAAADWWAVELEVIPQAGLLEFLCARLADRNKTQPRADDRHARLQGIAARGRDAA
jgi:tetraacyldisaccharide 4'-kinase